VSHIDRPVDAPRGEGRVLVMDDVTNGAGQLDHARIRERLSDDLDGSLSSAEQERIYQHLDGCDACRAFRNTLRKVVDVTGQLPTPRLPGEAKQRIIAQLQESSPSSPRRALTGD
jgi:predicted anti-sigma-YlaC factor YlaD